jgi:putative ATP-binding cassette transporter
LYPPDGGVCRLNGAQVDLGSLRELFALVMFDQPLLDRIYGGADPDPARVNALLDAFGVGHVTSFEQGRFTRLDLSSGQRKRVGLVVALLEDKPVLVLDEWAAEQDPPMRERFYRELLPAYKRAGKTIIAVSHDDRYFDLCDQLVVMRDGRVDYAGPPQAIRVGRFL